MIAKFDLAVAIHSALAENGLTVNERDTLQRYVDICGRGSPLVEIDVDPVIDDSFLETLLGHIKCQSNPNWISIGQLRIALDNAARISALQRSE